jgi:molybdenum cofactor synthesis domain-containing protein
MRIGIVTVSTSLARGERAADGSGDALAAFVVGPDLRATVAQRIVVADEQAAIAQVLREWADAARCDVALTTGGTGFAPQDVTPEATLAVVERLAPGLAEAMRAQTAVQAPLAWLSRGVAGIRGRMLIVNLPGSPKAVRECMVVLAPLLPHAVHILTGAVTQHD